MVAHYGMSRWSQPEHTNANTFPGGNGQTRLVYRPRLAWIHDSLLVPGYDILASSEPFMEEQLYGERIRSLSRVLLSPCLFWREAFTFMCCS